MNKDFSLSMSVYKNDNPDYFKTAVLSATIRQTLPPSEFVLVVDGPIPEILEKAIDEIKATLAMPTYIIRLSQNVGHARSRQTGLEATHFPIVAIHDSDDVCIPDRFEKQMQYISNHPELDVVGGQISEFIESEDNIVGKRMVPERDIDIKDYLRNRCPMNLMTVMAKKASVQKVGGFIDWYCEEDYFLWIRMALENCKFANMPDILVNVRVGRDMYSRRGGWNYFKSEAKLQKYLYSNQLISLPRLFINVMLRFGVQVMLSNSIRGWVFRNFARKR